MENPANLRYDERVEITRGLKKDSAHSKLILNLSTKSIVKDAWTKDRTFDELFKYFFKGYHNYITQVMTQIDAEYFNKMLDEMQAEFDAEPVPHETGTDDPIDFPKEDAPVQAS